jgi:hypothetical protein
MIANVTWNDKELVDGLNGLADGVRFELKGSCEELDKYGKNAWRKLIGKSGTLSKGKNGREWFSQDKKTWYITNEWLVPSYIWAGRNFVAGKRKQASKEMKLVLSKKKQDVLDNAVERAFKKF